MDNNCQIPDLAHTFSYIENGGLDLVLYYIMVMVNL